MYLFGKLRLMLTRSSALTNHEQSPPNGQNSARWPSAAHGLSVREIAYLSFNLLICMILYWIFVYYTAQGSGEILQDGEPGILENGQAFILFFSMLYAGSLSWKCQTASLKAWTGLITVGLFMMWGEEISWGQWFFHWQSPEVFLKHNIQSETNLHNLSAYWLMWGRNAIRFAVVFGGGIYPLIQRFCPQVPFVPPWLAPNIWGSIPAIFSGILACVAHFPSLAPFAFEADIFELSEAEELFLYLFFASYLAGLDMGLRAMRSSEREESSPAIV